MNSDVLEGFRSYLSEQVELLRVNLDAWVLAQSQAELADRGHADAAPLESRFSIGSSTAGEAMGMGPSDCVASTPAQRASGSLMALEVGEERMDGITRTFNCSGQMSDNSEGVLGRRAGSGVAGVNCSALKTNATGDSTALRCILAAAAAKRAVDSLIEPQDLTVVGVAKRFFGEWFSATIIVLNAVSIGMSAEISKGWVGWTVVDGVFAFLFLAEMLVRMYLVGARAYFIGSDFRCNIVRDMDLRWRLFEFILVLMAIAELGLQLQDPTPLESAGSNFNILRTLRLTRIARILRVCRLRIFTELVIMINGAIGGMRTLLWSLALVAIPLYAVSLLMYDSIGGFADNGLGAETFRTLPLAWFTMFRCTVASDCANSQGQPIALLVSENYGWGYGLIFCTTTILMTFGLFNVIAAIFVENTLAAAKSNSVLNKRQRLLDTQMFAEKASELVQFVWSVHHLRMEDPDWDVPGTTTSERCLQQRLRRMSERDIDEASVLHITPEFFAFLRTFREFKRLLGDLDIADEDQVDLFDTLDVDGGGTLDLEELVVGISKLRGDSRRSDIVAVGLVVRTLQAEIRGLRDTANRVSQTCEATRKDLTRLHQSVRSKSLAGASSVSVEGEILCSRRYIESSVV